MGVGRGVSNNSSEDGGSMIGNKYNREASPGCCRSDPVGESY